MWNIELTTLKNFILFIKKAIRRPPPKAIFSAASSAAVIITRTDHTISRKAISENALRVLNRIHQSGFGAYLVGGGVRDLLLGREPKDFDVATNAKPEQVKKIFRNCRLIGRRFRLAHVFFKDEIIEVATFRAATDDHYEEGHAQTLEGLLLRDNIYGTLEDDVWRRDFTVNALYYNIADFTVLDFVNGMADLKQGIIRIIGNPELRFREDPVRMLRAVRFAAKLGFRLHPDTAAPLATLGSLLSQVAPARLFDEILKLFLGGYAEETFVLLRHYDLLKWLFPLTDEILCQPGSHQCADNLILHTLKNTDERVSLGKPVTPAFLLTAMLWYPLLEQARQYQAEGLKPAQSFEKSLLKVMQIQSKHTAMPRRYLTVMQEICQLQYHLASRQGKRPMRLVLQARFRAGYDFLLMRAQAEPELAPLADWWTHFQIADEETKLSMLDALKAPPKKRRKPKRVQQEN